MKNIEAKKISQNLKSARIRAGLTQEQVAEKLGTSRVTISNYERNPLSLSFVKMKTLADIYDVDIAYFFGG